MTPNGLAPADPDVPHATGAFPGLPAQGVPEPDDSPPGPLLASGLNADIYALSERQVLRRYRCGRDAAGEAAIMRHVAAQDFPVPAAKHVGGPDLLMDRLHGPTLLQALVAGVVGIRNGAQILADLHRELHLIEAPGGGVVVHLDLHPANVVMTEARGPVLIDWANARAGDPALDVALTALILAEVAVDAGGEYSRGARALTAAFLGAADWHTGHDEPMAALADAVDFRLHDPMLVTGECDLVEPAAALVRRFAELAPRP